MIARIWRGAVRAEDGDEYADYIARTGMEEYAGTAGFVEAFMLRRDADGRAEFVTFSVWESMDAVRRFAGPDPERAVFYPEDDRFLVEREDTVTHYTVERRAGS